MISDLGGGGERIVIQHSLRNAGVVMNDRDGDGRCCRDVPALWTTIWVSCFSQSMSVFVRVGLQVHMMTFPIDLSVWQSKIIGSEPGKIKVMRSRLTVGHHVFKRITDAE